MSRSRRWCFTLNNPTEQESEFLSTLIQDLTSLSRMSLQYLVFGKECVQTPHFQGYLETTTRVRMTSLKKFFLERAHYEVAKGTSQEASDYCKKDGDFQEAGEMMKQGKRSDLDEIKELIETGATELEIAEQHFSRWVVYRRSFQAYSTLRAASRSWPTQVHVYWGKTGTGKTRFVMDQVMDSQFWSPGDYQWFDGYRGQEIVIFDDFRGEYKLQLLLKLCDRYPMSVPIKGGFTEWKPRKIYITSNIHPNDWYPQADRFSIGAMFRRFTLVEAMFESLY